MASTEDLRTALAVTRLAAKIDDLTRRLAAVERSSQLGYSSVEGAGLVVKDDAGTVRAVLGIQPDGTAGVRAVNGGPPPTPTAPIVLGGLGLVQVAWDGLWDDANSAPLDFARVRVHMSTDAAFTPSPANLVASIENPAGAVVTLNVDGYARRYVRLIAENTSGVTGGPSGLGAGDPEQVDGPDIRAGAITAEKIRAGAIEASRISSGVIAANAVPNPGFEDVTGGGWVAGSINGALLAHVGHAENGDLEGHTPRSGRGVGILRCSNTGAGSYLESTPFPVLAGLVYRAAVWARAASGTGLMNLRLYTASDEAGPWTLSAKSLTNAAVGTGWVRLDVTGVTIPAGHGWARLRFEAVSSEAASGTLLVDDALCLLLGFGGSELTGAGLRLYDADGDVTVDLSSTGSAGNYLSIQNDGATLAMISSEGVGSFARTESTLDAYVQGRPLVGDLTTWDTGAAIPPRAILERVNWGLAGFGARIGGDEVTNGEAGVFELSFKAKPGRMYRVEVEPVLVELSAGCSGGWRVRVAGPGAPYDGTAVAGPPNLSSEIAGYAYASNAATTAKYQTIHWSRTFWINPAGSPGIGPGVNRILFCLYAAGGTATLYGGQVYTATVMDLGPACLDTSVANTGLRTGEPVRSYTTTWDAQWSATYDYLGNWQQHRGNLMYQGWFSLATGGQLRSMVGFPAAEIASALAGATVTKAEVFLYANYWGLATGGTAQLGYHGATSRPATWSSGGGLTSPNWPRPGGRWVDLPAAWYPYFVNGWATGVTLGPAPGNSQSLLYYGKFDGAQYANAPKLRLTYRK